MTFFQDRAVYTCDEGYQIVGLEKVVCQVKNFISLFLEVRGGAYCTRQSILHTLFNI